LGYLQHAINLQLVVAFITNITIIRRLSRFLWNLKG